MQKSTAEQDGPGRTRTARFDVERDAARAPRLLADVVSLREIPNRMTGISVAAALRLLAPRRMLAALRAQRGLPPVCRTCDRAVAE